MIEVQSLSFTYPGSSRPALRNVSLSVSEGEYLAIAGANGSGKSTLIRCLNGLLRPPAGSVLVDGRDPSRKEDLLDIRRSISLVFQSPPDQIVASVVEEDAAFGLENLGIPRERMIERVRAALESVNLLEERERQTRFLSAGQQQRLAVAGAMVTNPRYVAFDEATSMIDPEGRAAILDRMDAITASGASVIHVTHDMDEAARARRVAVLSDGALVFDGSPSELFARGDLAALGLAFPRSWRLALDLGLTPIVGEDARGLGLRIAKASYPDDGAHGESKPSEAPARSERSEAVREGEHAFRLQDVRLSYLKGTTHERLAVVDASLDIPRGSVVALVGATGSGKSSLLQLMDALVFPDVGRVFSFGTDTSDPKADARSVRMRSPLAVQRPESALFEYYAGDEVSFGPRNQGLSGQPLVLRVSRAMEAVGLPYGEFRDRPTRSLSGGQKRKLALASVLSMDPDAVLLDEPGAALDPISRSALMDRVFSLAKEGTTVVFATHSMEEAARADFVAVLVGGRIMAVGEPRRIFGADWSPAWGLSLPFAAQVAAAVRKEGLEFPSEIVDDDGLTRFTRTITMGARRAAADPGREAVS